MNASRVGVAVNALVRVRGKYWALLSWSGGGGCFCCGSGDDVGCRGGRRGCLDEDGSRIRGSEAGAVGSDVVDGVSCGFPVINSKFQLLFTNARVAGPK